MRTIIQNGIVVTASETFKAHIVIEGERIIELTDSIVTQNEDLVINADGCYIFPGGIDAHTHLSWPSRGLFTADDFITGSKAAAVGGITSIVNYMSPTPGVGLIDNVARWKEVACTSAIDYGFHALMLECNDNILKELPILAEQEGITSIKVFMTYKNDIMVDDRVIYQLMNQAGRCGILTNVHAENGEVIEQLISEALEQSHTDPSYHADTRPVIMEAEAVHRALKIAELADAPVYIVHMTSAEALQQVALAKLRNVRAFAETCPQYLVLDRSELSRPGFEGSKYVCSPPLREKQDQEALWQGIANGIISVIGSDHCPFQYETQKMLGLNDFTKIPNGVPGIEDIFPIMYHFGVHEKRISLSKFVEMMSTGPARMFGLHPRKGSIAIGADADLVVLDPTRSRTISSTTQYQNLDYNLYEGYQVQGVITHVLSRGELLVQNGKFIGQIGRGRYLHRSKFDSTMTNL